METGYKSGSQRPSTQLLTWLYQENLLPEPLPFPKALKNIRTHECLFWLLLLVGASTVTTYGFW